MAPKRTTTANADSTSNKRRRGGNPLLRKCEVDIHVSLSHLMQFLKIMTPPVISRAHTYEPQQDLLRRYRTPTNIRALSGIAAYHELCLNLTINTNHITERINTTQPVSRRSHPLTLHTHAPPDRPQGLDVACSEITELAHLAAEAYHESLYALLSRTVHVVLTSWVTHGPALAAIESALVLIGAVSTSAQPGAGDCSPGEFDTSDLCGYERR
ncbi:hypothetical protein SARC_01300 [Sphaeroforma arctica JP610]|uniref:Uncharacterized protein n=1 Tax=Sphaeroforma arctica JP610 TaxID=667725 RepID=A0A0L0GBY7_9EUKA|nr:hypothetical protein SARC_01300 [Sphaeroforma arctica JP610]KNC86527.1 hypothetical protein SARC_01300 [Sphaeroforma arctica JP610]|eukprot:XP_014160429.1 hypothetical protein SARC_01300 [Sphaeroforma arctica JP610]